MTFRFNTKIGYLDVVGKGGRETVSGGIQREEHTNAVKRFGLYVSSLHDEQMLFSVL